MTKHSSQPYFRVIEISQVMMGMVIGATSAGTAVAYVGLYGNSHTGWAAICDRFGKFCDRIIISLCDVGRHRPPTPHQGGVANLKEASTGLLKRSSLERVDMITIKRGLVGFNDMCPSRHPASIDAPINGLQHCLSAHDCQYV
ncbi:hypothetical protein ACLOJK_019097 [Asimina triloba]